MFKSILLPIDLSAPDSWSRAAPTAIKMAHDGGVPLHVVTVIPDFGTSMVGSYFQDGYEKQALHDVGEKLTAWVSENVPSDVDVSPHVMHGRVYDKIIEAADRLGTDVIVMGSHQPELSDYLLGPNAARVVRHAKQSVFVIRPEA
ncbi:universal stress protein [Alphaproteobacteria bacterium GH1-50]|uniref:Universal stress protein n=1 Tax=Kangsaoukella pontilimi TaxID=2691042 RepID=A0A7C9IJ29_9RHOB|nr:universal stress protein [Kangsaoukella pontilimi]MXQ09687.1 universal stress protein [Kangsaoukella pontilimi]